MNIQARRIGNESLNKIVANNQERLQAMTIVHQQLYLQDDIDGMDIKEYLETLLKYVNSIYDVDHNIQTELNIESHYLDTETVTNLGMIVNELLVNAYKHAFFNVQEPKINITFLEINEKFLLQIKDNGTGLNQNLKSEPTKSFGLQLVDMLIDKLDAELQIDYKNGFCYEISFSKK
jgi:two-component sensor histidine kinase